jgi:2'-5' RNA ligase
MPRLGYVPHLTMLVWPDGDGQPIAACLSEAAAMAPREITIGTLGIAPGESGVLWLGVVTTAPLLALHAHLAAMVDAGIHPHYRPGAWMPHVTLVMAVPAARLAAAVECVAQRFAPFTASIRTIEVARFPPVQIIARHPPG